MFTRKVPRTDKAPVMDWVVSEVIVEGSITDEATIAAKAVRLVLADIRLGLVSIAVEIELMCR